MRTVLIWLLGLFPRRFRDRFETEMAAEIRIEWDKASTRSLLHRSITFIGTATDLVGAAIAERIAPAWDAPTPLNTEKKGTWMSSMSGWYDDLRFALRAIRRTPGFAVVAIATLGLAIGANAGLFSVVDTVLLRPLPYPDTGRLVYIAASAPGSDFPEEFGVSAEFYVQYHERSRLLEDVAVYQWGTSTLRTDVRAERVPFAFSTPSLFSTLGAVPLLGRLPTEEDGGSAAVISDRLWREWFDADPEVLGQTYFMAGSDRTVVGVMGPDFRFPNDDIHAWLTSGMDAAQVQTGRFGMQMVGRTVPVATIQDLSAELKGLAAELPGRFGGSANYARLIEQHRPVIRPLRDQMLGDVSTPLWILLGAVAILLLIACANVANLFIVRADSRQRDLAVRRAVGAGRSQLVRSLITEAFVIAGAAGGVAVLLAWVGVPVLLRAAPAGIPRMSDVHIAPSTLLFTLAVAIATALLCGLIPALRASAPDLTRLRDGSRGATRRRHWARDALVVIQTAFAVVLLIGSALLVRSFTELRNVEPGYETKDLFSFQIAPENGLEDAVSFARFEMDFMDRLRALPGVKAVGIIENLPLDEGLAGARAIPEEETGDEEAAMLLNYTWMAGDYFAAMGIQVIGGRTLSDEDQFSGEGNAVVSRTAAERLWPGEDAIGKRFHFEQMGGVMTVVGVVEDVMQYSFRDAPAPLIYLPLVGQSPDDWVRSSPAYVLKTPRADSIAPEIRSLVHEIAPEAPMYRVYTMEGLADDSMRSVSFTMLTLGIASALALILGMVGLYSVLSYLVSARTREIGVRMALGAQASRVLRMIVAQGLRVVVLGAIIGIGIALATTRVLHTLLFGVEAVDATVFIGMSTLMVAIGILATYLPARRAARVDPIRALREE